VPAAISVHPHHCKTAPQMAEWRVAQGPKSSSAETHTAVLRPVRISALFEPALRPNTHESAVFEVFFCGHTRKNGWLAQAVLY